MTQRKKVFLMTAAAVLVLLSIIIPNVLRSRISDGGDPGSRTVRTIKTSEISYSTAYPKTGYAPSLSVMRYGAHADCDESHACLLDSNLACLEGVGQAWCVKDGYRYNVQSSSAVPPYRDYWVTATPIQQGPGFKNFCSGSDSVIRSEKAAPLSRPYTLSECLSLKEDK